MKLLLNLSVLILISCAAHAQQPTPAKRISKEGTVEAYAGPSMKAKPGRTFREYTLIEDDRYVIRMNANREDEFEVFDSNLGIASSYNWTDARDKRGADIDVFKFNKRLYKLFGHVMVGEKKSNAVFITEYASKTGLSKDSVELERILEQDYYEYFNSSFVGVRVNRKQDLMLVYVRLPETVDNSGARSPKFRFSLFDASFEKIWTQELVFSDNRGSLSPSGDGWFSKSISNVFMAENGSAYITGVLSDSKAATKEEQRKLVVYCINKDGVVTTTTDFNPNAKFACTESQFAAIGTFGQFGVKQKNGDVLNGAEGLEVFKWNGTAPNGVIKKLSLGVDHLSNNKPEKVGNSLRKLEGKGQPLLSENLVLDNILLLEDNSFLITGQNRYSDKQVATNGFTTIKHLGKDIHAFHLTDKTVLDWSVQIPLNQVTKKKVGIGYGVKVWNGKAVFFFNDNASNLDKEWDTSQKVAKYTGSEDHVVAFVNVDLNDPSAEQKRTRFWKSRSAGVMMDPTRFYSDDSSNFGLLFLENESQKQRLLRLEFD